MGIDILDLQFRIRKEFGVKMTQDEYVYFADTAGQLHECLWERLQGRQPPLGDLFAIQRKLHQCLEGLFKFQRRPGTRWWQLIWELTATGDDPLAERLGCPLPPLENDDLGWRLPKRCRDPNRFPLWLCAYQPQVAPLVKEPQKIPPPEDAGT